MYKIGTFQDVLDILDRDQPLAFDTETIGFYGKIRLAQFYQSAWNEVIIIDKPNALELLSFLGNIKEVKLIFQNASYDVSTIQDQTGARYIPENFEDTLYLARLAYPTLESYSLDELYKPILGMDPYVDNRLDKKKLQKSNWASHILTDDQLVYASLDVYYLLEVYEVIKSFTDDISYKLDKLSVRYAMDFQRNGFAVDIEAVESKLRENTKILSDMAMPINVNSWQQVRPYINSEESDALALATLAIKGNERALNVLTARKLIKQNSFLEKFITDDGRIYGKFAPGARSGRFTCKDQNLQQLPRKLKHCFGVQDGFVLLYGDYPQLELRTIAIISLDKVLIELLRRGEDPHAYVAEKLFGKNWTSDDRQIVKTYNFNLLYVGGAIMVQSIFIKDHMLYRDISRIQKDIAKWKNTWQGITRWQEECIRSHRRGAIKQTPLGRRYIGKRITDHANIENSGFGAEIAKLAMHYMTPDLKANDAKLTNFIHDSFHVEMDYDPTANRRVASLMKEAMQEAWFEGSKMTEIQDVPMPVKVACGTNWGEIEKGNFIFEV